MLAFTARAEEPARIQPKFLGAQSCAASSCHGGAGEKSDEYTIWSTRDFHHQRPLATLTTARSERLAEVLKIGNPSQSVRCTVCHAPFASVPSERLAKEVKITEGVSCESCHGAAENWIRSHTRPDYTHADRVAAGMRDLKNLYVRANTCVACHQVLPGDIRAAGHPELIFEMDGQSVTMPRHWRETTNWSSAQVWLAGQAVALREMSWQLLNDKSSDRALVERWAGLTWVLDRVDGSGRFPQNLKPDLAGPAPEEIKKAQAASDQTARDAAATELKPLNIGLVFAELADSSEAFSEKGVSKQIQARRAERLVLALDRITSGPGNLSSRPKVNEALDRLFMDVQSLPDFDPNQFAKDLKAFQASVSNLESK